MHAVLRANPDIVLQLSDLHSDLVLRFKEEADAD